MPARQACICLVCRARRPARLTALALAHYGDARVTSPRPLGFRTKLLYGLGAVSFGVKDNGFSFFLLLYYNQVLGLPESWVGLGIMVALIADAVFDPLVGYASDHLHSRWGRRHPFLYASAVPIANGSRALLPLLFCFGTVGVMLFIMSSILTSSMVADIVEDSEVTTGRRSEGVFVAANSFVLKAVSGIGIFASSLLLGAIGFPRDAKPGQVDPEVVHRLGLVYAPTIVVLFLIALAFLSTYRISRARHEANLRRLASAAEPPR